MYKITIIFGLLLMATGLVGYFGTGAENLTALIPSAIGIILLLCGFIAANEKCRMAAMHIAVSIGLLGVLGLIPQLMKENQPNAALASKITTLTLCVVFVGLCVRSFIQARRARDAAADSQDIEEQHETTTEN
tara:strand:+ start:1069 stop:1467 length:399 start_codon:yes stop_codon:yes gene_type:complete